MAKGEHFFVWRNHLGVPYQHHGIDVGDGQVIHFADAQGDAAGPGQSTDGFVISQVPMSLLTRDGRSRVHWVHHSDSISPDEVVQRAKSQIGRQGYDLVFNNCEHFASWCVVGQQTSRQVQVACERVGAVAAKTIVASSLRLASRLGAKRVVRGTNPAMFVADLLQWATEAGGHHVGLTSPKHRKRAGRAVGGVTAVGLGALAGPAGIVVAGGVWAFGEVAGEMTSGAYERVRANEN